MYHRPAYAAEGTKGRRKEARREVRWLLGTSSEAAPELHAALRAAENLKRIIDLASGGRYGLAIVRATDGETEQGQLAWYRNELVRSSQIHEPVSETIKRENELRERASA